ncbi:RNA 2',3'-cyclic phosphodiesterase [Candidatus Woesearchaeota archaeon]|nr:RNA 2',3'-cyclic phosphodiesterase [Candidatus Woesearchaeota archaeon]
MRLFIAFEVPPEVHEILLSAQNDIQTADAKLKPAKSFHLTLKFLGEVEEKAVPELKQRLEKVRFEPFKARAEGIGVFPSEDYIRVVWAGLQPEKRIISLQSMIDRSLEGMFPKEKNFKPHLTLARVRYVDDKEKFVQKIRSTGIMSPEFTVKSFSLIKSTLTKQGPVYEKIQSYPR